MARLGVRQSLVGGMGTNDTHEDIGESMLETMLGGVAFAVFLLAQVAAVIAINTGEIAPARAPR